jgi:predicted PurR-regulated permease PerM
MTNRRIFTATLTVLGTAAVAFFLLRIWEILLVLFLSVVFASTIRPAVEWLERRGLSRALGIILLYLSVFVSIAGLLILVIPSLVDMGIALFVNGQLMDHLRQLAGQLSVFGWQEYGIFLPVFTLPDKLLAFLESVAGDAGQQALPIARGTILTLGQIVLVFVMAFYWLTARSRIIDLRRPDLGRHSGSSCWHHSVRAHSPIRDWLVRPGATDRRAHTRPSHHAPRLQHDSSIQRLPSSR